MNSMKAGQFQVVSCGFCSSSCLAVDESGELIKTDPVVYAFLWDGIFVLAGLIVVVGLSFALAAPAGAFIAKLLNRSGTR